MLERAGVLRGMAGGLIAAGVMSTARLLAHRAGLIERMVPQVLEERAAGEAGGMRPRDQALQQLAAEALHQGVSLTAGALLGAATANPGIASGVGYGLAIWLVALAGLMPALGVRRLGGRAVDAAAHAIFGAVLAFAMRELASQPRLQPTTTAIPMGRRVG